MEELVIKVENYILLGECLKIIERKKIIIQFMPVCKADLTGMTSSTT